MKKIKKIFLIVFTVLIFAPFCFANEDLGTKQKAMMFYQNKQYDKALKEFLSLSEDEITDEIMILISNSYDSCGEKILAYNTLQELIKKSPKNYKAYYNLGVLNYKNNNIDFATECFLKAVKLNKKSHEANYNLAYCYLKKKDYKSAIKYFKKALKYNHISPETYYNLAYTYKMLGDIKKYNEYFEAYKKLN